MWLNTKYLENLVILSVLSSLRMLLLQFKPSALHPGIISYFIYSMWYLFVEYSRL